MVRKRQVLILVMVMVLAACGGDTGSTETTAGEVDSGSDAPTSTTESVQQTDDTDPEDTEQPDASSEAPDYSDVDWATVDLTTIDWANIDMSQVNFTAIEENPTAATLDEETVDLIRSRMSPGRATLTIGDLTWEFDGFLCAFGHSATQSDVYSFSSDAQGEHEGVRVQMQLNIRDESGEGRYEGSDVDPEVFIQDIEDFDNPSIHYATTELSVVEIGHNDVRAEGTFDDKLTDGPDGLPGTLEATCGDGSSRG